MRRGLVAAFAAVLTAGAALVVVGAVAVPAQAATPTNLRVTLQAPPLSGGSDPRCCSFTAFEGTDTIPLLGKATFTGFFETGCIVDPFEPEVSFCFRGLDFTAVGSNGRTLHLGESQAWPWLTPAPPTTWITLGPDFTGSGTYEFVDGYPEVTITLTGTLHPA